MNTQNILSDNIVNDRYLVNTFYPFSISRTWPAHIKLVSTWFDSQIRSYSLVEAHIESSTRLIKYFNESKSVKNKEVKIKKHQDIIKKLINAYCDELI